MNTCGDFLCHAEALKKLKRRKQKTETQTKVRMAALLPIPKFLNFEFQNIVCRLDQPLARDKLKVV